MDQQLTGPLGLVIPKGCLRILGNITSDQPKRFAADASIGFIQLALAVTKTFYLTAQQDHPTFDRVEDFVFVASLSVFAYQFDGRRGR